MSILLKNSNALFIHIPKTGGLFCTQALRQLGLEKTVIGNAHSDIQEINHFASIFPNQYIRKTLHFQADMHKLVMQAFKFCFIRYPLSWYESFWKYKVCRWDYGNEHNIYKYHPLKTLYSVREDNFNEFVIRLNEFYPGFVSTLYNHYITPDIDFIGTTENLKQDLIYVLELLSYKVDKQKILSLAPYNVSPSLKGNPIWDETLKKEIKQLEYSGIKLWEKAKQKYLVCQ